MTAKPAPRHRFAFQAVLSAAWEGIARPKIAVLIILGYCVVHFAVRLALSPVYSIDEAEQMLFAQDLSMGYRFRHPPLMTWLVWGTQQVFGLERAALFGLKYAIMAAGFIAFYFAGRAVLKDSRLAAFATAAFSMTYTVGYYPHLDLMHTVLLTALLGAGLLVATEVLEHGRWRDYLLYGVVTALGILSKYVYGIFAVGVIVGVLMVPGLRRRLSIPKALASLVLTALLLAPYSWWAASYDNSLVALAETMTRPEEVKVGLVGGWLRGTGMLTWSLAEFTLPFSLIFLALFWRHLRAPAATAEEDRPLADYLRLFEWIMGTGAVVMLLAVFFFGATHFKGRWMHEVLMPLPIYLFGRVVLASRGQGLPMRSLRIYGSTAAVLALLVVTARIVSFEANADRCKKCWEYQPFAAYARGLHEKGFTTGTILVDNMYVGGNLRPFFPHARILMRGYPTSIFPDAEPGAPCAMAWLTDARDREIDPGRPGARLPLDGLPEGHMRLRVRSRAEGGSPRWFAMHYVLMPGGGEPCR